MTSNSSIPVVLNPYTPLAFLPPTAADQFQTSCYFYVAGISIFVWDWVMSIPDELKVLRKSKLCIPIVVYFLSRFGVLGYAVAANIFQLAAVGHCQALIYITGGFLIVGISSTFLLFLFRLRAVYGGSKIVTGFFGIFWVVNFGLTFMVPLSLEGHFLGPTKRCYSTPLRPIAALPVILNGVYDTLVFLAISFRLGSFAITGDTWWTRTKYLFSAGGLPLLSKSLLQGGQLYYLVSALTSGATIILVFTPNIPPFYRALFAVPSVTLPNIMACRVFRDLRLCYIREVQSTTVPGSRTVSGVHFASRHEAPLTSRTLNDSRDVKIDITKTTIIEDSKNLYTYTKQSPYGEGSSKHESIEFKVYGSDNV